MINPHGWGADRALLKRSLSEWNRLRHVHPDYIPQLTGADLEGLDLSGADLALADLRGAYLNGATLRRASFRGADLRRAHMTYCDLTAADLRGAKLSRADLRGSVLIRAKLRDAIITGTILDPGRWSRELLQLWDAACPERKQHLVDALFSKAALRRGWTNGTAACPEAILSECGGETGDFMAAWSTYGITEQQVLRVLGADALPRFSAAAG